jgi:transcription elongation factor GreB
MTSPSQRPARPPEPPKRSDYITKEGWRRLQSELERLWKLERPRITAEVEAAAAHGDRSENAEYIYGKKKLRELDRRIRFLAKRLDVLTVVESSPLQEGKVYFGAWVSLESEQDGEQFTVRIVGPDEPDAAQNWVSVDSPLAQALLRKQEGDVVTVERPKGSAKYTVVEIEYAHQRG